MQCLSLSSLLRHGEERMKTESVQEESADENILNGERGSKRIEKITK
jgi:hypothetical protein